MDKFQFVRIGVTRLPPGFRFQPTDEELVFHYLKCKVFSFPLPAPIIPDINVYKYDPRDLPGNLEQERYFFSNKEAKYPNGNRNNRATTSGYWKATGLDKQILSSGRINNQMVGMKRSLVFYRGKQQHESITDWIMHEYRLVSTANTQNNSKEMENWVICRIFLKKRSMKDHANIEKMDLCAVTSSCSSTSSYSGINEASSIGSDSEYDDEESSSSNSSNIF